MPNLRDIRNSVRNKVLKPIVRTAQRVQYSWKDYDLWKEIFNHPWLKGGAPQKKAIEWYRKTVITDKDYFLKQKLLRQGTLVMFDYDHPKYEDILDYFDTQPLVISIGSTNTSEGWRDLGINMHLLPPRIRRVIMYQIFELYRYKYREQLFKKKEDEVQVKWQDLIKPLQKFGVAFAVRMYIPERRKNVIEFKYEDWKNAIFIESKGYKKITIEALEKKWAEFVHKNKDKPLKESWTNS